MELYQVVKIYPYTKTPPIEEQPVLSLCLVGYSTVKCVLSALPGTTRICCKTPGERPNTTASIHHLRVVREPYSVCILCLSIAYRGQNENSTDRLKSIFWKSPSVKLFVTTLLSISERHGGVIGEQDSQLHQVDKTMLAPTTLKI